MKKILDLLEQKIQWIVLGIAVLYAGYMGYTYLITPQATATIGGDEVALGDIDHKTVEDQVSRLESLLNQQRLVQKAEAPSYVAKFRDSMGYTKEPAPAWTDATVVVQHLPMFKLDELKPDDKNDEAGGQKDKIAELLKLVVPAKVIATRTGLTNVLIGPQGNNLALAANGADKVWASVRFEINPKDLVDAFDAAKIPANLDTLFVQVKLERQELNGGVWGPPTVVPGLTNVQLQPVPAANADRPVVGPFLEWAKGHQTEILQPPFYTRIKGDEWIVPDNAVAAAPVPPPQPPPARGPARGGTAPRGNQPRANTPRGNTPPRGNTTPPRGGTTPGGQRGRGTPAPTPAPPDGGAPEFHFAADTASDRPISFQNEVPAGGAQPQPEPGAEPAAVAPPTVYSGPENGKVFDPRKWTPQNLNIPNITGWAHDDTVVPGHTYRYRVTYKIKNPVAFRTDIVKDPKTAGVAFIESPPSDWSREIEISSTINYFLAKKGSTPNSVTIQVFKNQGGQMHTKMFDVTAGDMIGEPAGAVDFTTGATMVDLREDQKGEAYVLLMDPAGAIHRRSITEDSKSDKYLKLKAMVAGGAPNAGPVAGAQPR